MAFAPTNNQLVANAARNKLTSLIQDNATTNHSHHILSLNTSKTKSARPRAHNVNIAHKVNRLEAYANRTNNQIDTIEYSILSSEQHKSP